MAQAAPASIPQTLSAQQAAAEIVALINSRPTSPRPDEIEAVIGRVVPSGTVPATPLLTKIRETAARLDEAFDVHGKVRPGDPAEEATQARIDQLQGDLEDLEGQISAPPQSFADLLAWAEIAYAGADIREDCTISETSEPDVFLRPAGRLVEAVLHCRGTLPGAASMSPAHAEHFREWRALIENHMREFENVDETGMTDAEVRAEEARLGAHMATMEALAHRVFAVPARAWGDILLFAELCLWAHLGGVDPEGPNAPSELQSGLDSCGEMPDLALVKLLEAVFTVAGVGQFAGVRHG